MLSLKSQRETEVVLRIWFVLREFVLLYNKSEITGPLGNSEFCFPQISMLPSTSSPATSRFSGDKTHCSPREHYVLRN